MNILEKANEIVNMRSEEKERMYGNFGDSMEKMRDLFNLMTGQNLKTEDMFLAMVAMKLARQSHAHKEDNILDAVAYLGALNNYIEAKKPIESDSVININKGFIPTKGLPITIVVDSDKHIAFFDYNSGIEYAQKKSLRFTKLYSKILLGTHYKVDNGYVLLVVQKSDFKDIKRTKKEA